MAGDVVAAGVHRQHPLSLRRNPAAGRVALYEVPRRIPAVDAGIAPAALVARRFVAGGLYCRFQLGVAAHVGVARGALSWRRASLGAVVGGETAADLGERAALRPGFADAGRHRRFVLAGVADDAVEPAR